MLAILLNHGLTSTDPPDCDGLLTTRTEPAQVTANLLGPLVLNPAARLGLQLVLIDSPYSTQYPLAAAQPREGEVA